MKAVYYIDSAGITRYFLGVMKHREDGPAVIYPSGKRLLWYQYDKLHRLDGPAFIDYDVHRWYINGKLINCNSQEEFERLIKLQAFW